MLNKSCGSVRPRSGQDFQDLFREEKGNMPVVERHALEEGVVGLLEALGGVHLHVAFQRGQQEVLEVVSPQLV